MEDNEKIGLFKWFVDMAPEAKLVIALLLGLNCVLGYVTWETNKKYDTLYDKYSKLHVEYTEYTKSGSNKVLEVNQDWQKKMDEYRNQVESDTKERAKEWQSKYEDVNTKLQRSDEKLRRTEDVIEAINKKLK